MNCQEYELALGDYVDGTVDAQTRADLSLHLARCARCQALAADLAAIRRAAGDLDLVVPSAHVWTKLSAAIEAERGHGERLWGLFSWQRYAAAAVAVTLAAGLSWVGSRLALVPVPASEASSTSAALGDAEAEFATAIAGLESITQREQAALDMDTADVVRASLTVVDGAINESRAALKTEPDNQAAQDSLFEALRSKVELLQNIVSLINEMRKGNPEGAARIVSGLNQ